MRFIDWLRGQRQAELAAVQQRDDLEHLSWDEFIAVPRTVTEVQVWLSHNPDPPGVSVRIKADRSRCEDAAHGR